MACADRLCVTVLYSPAARAVQEWSLQLAAGARLKDALQWVGQQPDVPPALRQALVQPDALRLGLWGRRASLEDALREHDRVEIYRPLTVDPKLARRERFARQGRRSAGLFARRGRPSGSSG